MSVRQYAWPRLSPLRSLKNVRSHPDLFRRFREAQIEQKLHSSSLDNLRWGLALTILVMGPEYTRLTTCRCTLWLLMPSMRQQVISSHDIDCIISIDPCHLVTLVASLMSLMASLVTTSRMQQCFNVPIDSYHEFLLLFYCCVLLEIKLTTTTTTSMTKGRMWPCHTPVENTEMIEIVIYCENKTGTIFEIYLSHVMRSDRMVHETLSLHHTSIFWHCTSML